VPHLREKTLKIGLVGRAAAIFRVDEIIVFPDISKDFQEKDVNLVATILSYMDTPQYLRKRLFKIKPELRYVGVLPPLRTPHHPLSDRLRDLKVGAHRDGLVVSKVKEGSLLDVGLKRLVFIPNTQLHLKARVTVKFEHLGKQPKASLMSRENIKEYWGYRVIVSEIPIVQFLRNRSFDLIIAASRHGTSYLEVESDLKRLWKISRTILVAFGAPTQGLYEIVARERQDLRTIANFVVNTIPNQGVKTVRTEEAMYATLTILNLFFDDK
jgi:hypothetical protein